jgi:hypothetical protein
VKVANIIEVRDCPILYTCVRADADLVDVADLLPEVENGLRAIIVVDDFHHPAGCWLQSAGLWFLVHHDPDFIGNMSR